MDACNRVLATVLLATASAGALAGEGGAALGPGWVAMPVERLDRMRGGFELPSGLVLSFGIERLVYVNGNLVAQASVRIPDVSRITPEQARQLAQMKQGMVVQVGGGNAFAPSGVVDAVVIQNSLDGTDIRAMTTLDVGVGTLGMFQHLNATAALQDALNRAPGSP